MTSSPGISLHVTVTVAPENADELLRLAKPTIDVIAAEPECLYFEVVQSKDQPGRFQIVENWNKDWDWFLNHQLTKSYYKDYEAATRPLWIEERKIEVFERLAGWTKAKPENLN